MSRPTMEIKSGAAAARNCLPSDVAEADITARNCDTVIQASMKKGEGGGEKEGWGNGVLEYWSDGVLECWRSKREAHGARWLNMNFSHFFWNACMSVSPRIFCKVLYPVGSVFAWAANS